MQVCHVYKNKDTENVDDRIVVVKETVICLFVLINKLGSYFLHELKHKPDKDL